MSRIVYDAELLKIMHLFELITQTKLKDCFRDDNNLLTFVVSERELGKAIGKNGINIKKLAKTTGKTIEIIGFDDKTEEFLKKAFNKIKIDEVEITEKTAFITLDLENKRLLLRNKKRFERIKNFALRNYNIADIRIR